MSEIVLSTISAKYVHSGLGIRYLYANLGELKSRASIIEFNLGLPIVEMAEKIIEQAPTIIGLSVYIWNVRQSCDLIRILKAISPRLLVVVGGPEAGYAFDHSEIVTLADFVIKGEGETAFRKLCNELLAGSGALTQPLPKRIESSPLDLAQLAMPYEYYTEDDLKNKLTYVETSRGCPFSCEFCLSSLDKGVRFFDLPLFFAQMDTLINRGARKFKFVDRTFNVNTRHALAVLDFFLGHLKTVSLFVHFEVVPDRIDSSILEKMKSFPPGTLQLEVGVQTFDPEVAARINRKQNFIKTEETLRWLKSETQAHIHADLIVGLPGETLKMFGSGFDRLLSLAPQEIQVGILKKLGGTPIVRHEKEWRLVFSEMPPYEILETSTLSFQELQRMRRFARYWEIFYNSGAHSDLMLRLLNSKTSDSSFDKFLAFADWLFERTAATHEFSLQRRKLLLEEYLQ